MAKKFKFAYQKNRIMNISFTDKQEKYIATQVKSGDFQNASEVVRDALRLHEVYRHKIIEELRAEINKGWDEVPVTRNVRDILKDKLESLKK
jgi:antitoxin ParD1/3/4